MFLNDSKNDSSTFGQPIHNPPYSDREVEMFFNQTKIEVELKDREIINKIVPKPLEFVENSLFYVINNFYKYKGDLPAHFQNLEWFEILIQVPVEYNGQYYLFFADGWVNHPGIVMIDREIYGHPKIFTNVDYRKLEDNKYTAAVSYYKSDKKIISTSFTAQRPGTPADVGKRGKLVALKHIPTPDKQDKPAIKQLICMEYNKLNVKSLLVGEGSVEFGDDIPEYLKLAGIKNVVKSLFVDAEIGIAGGSILHEFNTR